MFSPLTPGKSRLSVSSRKSMTTARSNRSLNRSRAKKSVFADQSGYGPHVIEETPQHRIETVGLTLPVLITEALTLSDRSTTEVTACVDHSGWAWLVGGRKLFVWRYKSSGNTRSVPVCKELTLPPSDLAHSAERVCLIPRENEGQPAACVAVSPEGIVRYWPNIAFESSTAEISAELKGEECARVIDFQPYGCLLATTTSSLLLLEPIAGQASIQCKPLKSSQGLFSGISRRMSSFIFGASMIETNGAPLKTIVAGPQDEYTEDEDDDRRSFYVLAGSHINKWQVPTIGPEKLLYQMEADRVFRESLAKHVWDQDCVQLPQLDTWLLDLQLTSEGIVLLGAGVNSEVDSTLYYALVYLTSKMDALPTVEDFVLLDYNQKYSEGTEGQTLSYRLLLPSPSSNTVFIYSSASILMLTDKTSLDKMDLKTSGDCLLGAGKADGLAAFFSNTHGIFSVSAPRPDMSIMDESNNQGASLSRTEISNVALNMSRSANLTDSTDKKGMLKNAFIAMISGDRDQAENLLEELRDLAQGPAVASGVQGSELDTVVAATSKDLVDDPPNADPRWTESGLRDSSSRTASVIIVQQLKDKQVAHDLYVTFLKESNLWSQLGCVTNSSGSLIPTPLLLSEHVEKLEAAIGLRELHLEHSKLVDWCIKTAIKNRQLSVPEDLGPQDLFYREVSKIQEILPVLVDKEKELLSVDQPSHSAINVILAVSSIIGNMLHLALQYRQSHAEKYSRDSQAMPEYIPWTACTVVREAIMQQVNLSLERGISEAKEVDVQGLLYQNIVGLADILMDGYACQLRSLQADSAAALRYDKLEKEFQKRRHSLIIPLLEHKQYDRAASLAEKYEDFEMLMRICDATDNQERLQHYRTQYADKGFAQFLFNWYMKEGKRSHLLSQPVTQGDELSKFLDSDNVKYLSWVHEIRRENYTEAQKSLGDLARNEKNFLSKKKTLLSLCKLAALASEDSDDVKEDNIEMIDEELDLILHQELLPTPAIEAVGMDPDNMRVLTPEELIELYVSEKNVNANELDVKKALDVLSHVDRDQEDIDFDAIKLHIWSRAILMDKWADDSTGADPLASAMNKIFFKTIGLFEGDGSLSVLLPEQADLMASPELSQLSKQTHFQYLIRAGYEHITADMAMEN